MSRKKELAKQYARQKIDEKGLYPLAGNYAREKLTTFGGDALRKAFEAGRDSALVSACEWLENNLSQETSVISGGYVHINFENVIKKFIKYMEE